MTADEQRAELAAALVQLWTEDAGESLDGVLDVEMVAAYLDNLMPVVERIATARAAEALRAADVPGLAKSYAAQCVREALYAAADEWPDAYASSVSDWLRDRADALDPS